MSLLAAAEAKRMYSGIHFRGGSNFPDREGCESQVYTVRSLLPSISITPSGSVPGATSPATNR